MLVNKKRRARRKTKRAMPAGLKRYWASRRRAPKRRVKVVHYAVNKRRAVRRRHNPKGGSGSPSTMAGFISARYLSAAGMVVLGALAPSMVTDRVLPMVGLQLTGLTRRLAQLAVPAALVAFGGKRMLGQYATPFLLGATGFTLYGLVNDFLPGVLPTAALAGVSPGLGRYALPPAGVTGLGRYSPTPKVLAA